MDTCYYCSLDSGGNHELSCPLHPDNQYKPLEQGIPLQYYSNYGWICPVCGMGNAPFNRTCPCKDGEYKITYGPTCSCGGSGC